MKTTANAERKHIVFTGRRNAGKSSLVNRITGQELSIVSNIPGTTTDPVKKAMELLPFGPVVIVDTAGIDDTGELGEKRISQTDKSVAGADLVVLVVDGTVPLSDYETAIIDKCKKSGIALITVINKTDLGVDYSLIEQLNNAGIKHYSVSSLTGDGINHLKDKMQSAIPDETPRPLIGDLVKRHDTVVLVVPIDLGAPKGRLIMPQVQTIRESLDEDTIVIVTKERELTAALDNLKKPPALVVTDSQAVMKVNADVPEEIPLTTFSVLMARYKGDLPEYVRGLRRVEELKNGDKVLIAEACTHHAQEDDIGKVKIPRWLRLHTKKDLDIVVKNGADYPADLSEYKLIVHCGGCMLTRKMMQSRIIEAGFAGVPIVNYGVLISYMHGAVPRAIKPFPEAISTWEGVKNDMNFVI